jgi:plastocyanin
MASATKGDEMAPVTADQRTVFARLPALALTVALLVLSGCSASALPSPSASPAPSAVSVDGTASPGPSTASAPASPAPRPTIAVIKITPIPDAPDSKTVIKLFAFHVRWVPNALTAPAGQGWRVEIDNQDGPPEHHNFAVASGKTFAEQIYQSPNFNEGTFTYDVPALPAGNYLFICTVHPDVMTGTLELR